MSRRAGVDSDQMVPPKRFKTASGGAAPADATAAVAEDASITQTPSEWKILATTGAPPTPEPITAAIAEAVALACDIAMDVARVVARYTSDIVVAFTTKLPETLRFVDGGYSDETSGSNKTVFRSELVRDFRIGSSSGHLWILKSPTPQRHGEATVLEQRRLVPLSTCHPPVALEVGPCSARATDSVNSEISNDVSIDRIAVLDKFSLGRGRRVLFPLDPVDRWGGVRPDILTVAVPLSDEQVRMITSHREEWDLGNDVDPASMFLEISSEHRDLLKLTSRPIGTRGRLLGILVIPDLRTRKRLVSVRMIPNGDRNLRCIVDGTIVVTISPRCETGGTASALSLVTMHVVHTLQSIPWQGMFEATPTEIIRVILNGIQCCPLDGDGLVYTFGIVTYRTCVQKMLSVDGVDVASLEPNEYVEYDERLRAIGDALFVGSNRRIFRFDRSKATSRWTFTRVVVTFTTDIHKFDAAIL